jgi:hypothetical protein
MVEFPEFARILVRLSGYYGDVHRVDERSKIDSQLRTGFALADPDYFVARYLRAEISTAPKATQMGAVH